MIDRECTTPWKTPFSSEAAALSSVTRRDVELELRAYTCTCGWAHLTRRAGLPTPVESAEVTARVAALSDADFLTLVGADVRADVTAEEAAALRAPVNLHRWAAALKDLEVDLQLQFANRRDQVSPLTVDWRRRAVAVRSFIQQRREEAKSALAALRAADAAERARVLALSGLPLNEARAAVGDLAVQRLIDAHQAEFGLLLAEEFERAGLEVPTRVARHIARNSVGVDR